MARLQYLSKLVFSILASVAIFATDVYAAQVTLAWDPVVGDVGGYKLYWGTQSRVYPNVLDVGNNTQGTITGLADATLYYIAVTAYSTDRTVESDYSNEITYLTPVEGILPTTPANFTATVVSSTQINLSWSPSTDNIGIEGYRIYRDSTFITTVTATNYSDTGLTPSTTYAYYVRSRDVSGNSSTPTSTVTVTTSAPPDTTAPTVALSAPAAGATVTGTVAVSATASDNVAVVGVQFRLDGQNLGSEDTSSPYSISWNSTQATNGSHTLTAVARDAAGNSKTSSSRTVTVSNGSTDTTAPTVSLTAPSAGATVTGTVTVSANASDNVGVVGVQFRLDGQNLGNEDTNSPYLISWNTTQATNGSHTLTAVARDAAGNTKTSSSRTVTVSNTPSDTTAPTVSLSAPAAGATVNGTVTVSATASDNIGVVGVQFRLDGQNLGSEDTTSPYSVSWNTAQATNGNHTLSAIARDAAGNTRTAANRTVMVSNNTPDTTAPTVSLTAPSAGATVAGSVAVSASASDDVGVAGVQFKLDGQNLGAEDTVSPYSVILDSALLSNGGHTIGAVARDAAGNQRTAQEVSITVENVRSLGGVVTFEGAGLAGVTIYGGDLGTVTTNQDGAFSVGSLALGSTYTITLSLTGYGISPSSVSGVLNSDTTLSFVASKLDTDSDGLTDLEENDRGTDPAKADTDSDTVNDGQEVLDGSNPLDKGSVIVKLEKKVCADWNGFLGITNIVEHVNVSSSAIKVRTTLYDLSGVARSNVSFSLAVGQQVDIIASDMEGFAADTYGRVCSEVIRGAAGDLDGRMVYYKTDEAGAYQFAFAMAFSVPVAGPQYVQFDTNNQSSLAADASDLVTNWIQITNNETTKQKGKVILYDEKGVILNETSVTIDAQGRRDVAAHPAAKRRGLVAWVPASRSARFGVRNVRYYFDNAEAVASFRAAYSVEGSVGSGETLILPVDVQNSNAVLAISNVKNESVSVQYTIRDAGGASLRSRKVNLAAHASGVINVKSYLTSGVGTVTLKGASASSVVATLVQTGVQSNGEIEHVYVQKAEQTLGSVLSGSYNTFLGQSCRLHLANSLASEASVSVSMKRFDGTELLKGKVLKVPAHGVLDYNLCAKEKQQAYGKVTVQPGVGNSILADVLRVAADNAYRFSTPVRE